MPVSERASQGLALAPFSLSVASLTPAQAERVGLGSYLVNAVAHCGRCHDGENAAGQSAPLAGGRRFELPGGGSVRARNLTTHPTTGLLLSLELFRETLRTGRDPRDGSTLLVMPFATFRWMSDEDIENIYTYLRQVPAVDRAIEPDDKPTLTPPAAPTLYDEGDVPRPLPAPGSADPLALRRGLAIQPLAEPPGLAAEDLAVQRRFARGSYLANAVADCNGCHTRAPRELTPGSDWLEVNTAGYLAGGQLLVLAPDDALVSGVAWAVSPNLTGEKHGFSGSYFDFLARMAGEATAPWRGHRAPWPAYGGLVADDLDALATYVARVPARTGDVDREVRAPARFCAGDGGCEAGETCDLATSSCQGTACADSATCAACQACAAGACQAPADLAACMP